MELEDLLRQAVAAVEAAGVPDDLRQLAFARALQALGGEVERPRALTSGRTSGSDLDPGTEGGTGTGPASSSSDTPELGPIAAFFGLSDDVVEDYFHVDEDGALRLEFDVDRLGSNNAARAKAVAVLLIVARQVSGIDSDKTPIEAVRLECERLGVYDSKNFSTQIGTLSSSIVITGAKQGRMFKVKPASRQKAKDIMAEVVAGS